MAQLVDNNGAFDPRILRTKGSWVQVLPGAPIFNDLRSASEIVSRSAGPFMHRSERGAFATRSTVQVPSRFKTKLASLMRRPTSALA